MAKVRTHSPAGERQFRWNVSRGQGRHRAWLSFYNQERQHQSLGYRTPRQIYQEGLCLALDRALHPDGYAGKGRGDTTGTYRVGSCAVIEVECSSSLLRLSIAPTAWELRSAKHWYGEMSYAGCKKEGPPTSTISRTKGAGQDWPTEGAVTRIFPIYKKEESQFAAVLLRFPAVAETESGGRETE